MTARERIQKEIEQWFLTEPVFFTVYCSHSLVMNANMLCPLRSGKGRIEYNPAIIETMTESRLRDLLRVEIIRILLQHPYARQPIGCPSIVLQTASDLVISQAYNLAWANLAHPTDFGFPTGQHYEWYAMRLNEILDNLQQEGEQQQQESEQQQGQDSSSQGKNEAAEARASNNSEQESKQQQGQNNSSQGKQQQESGQSEASSSNENSDNNNTPTSGYTDLWEEDQFQARQITDIVKSSSSWGSLPGDLIELIKKTAEGKVDFRAVLRMFRASIISQKRRLTRMRPSRRFGFEQMGSRYDFTTRLLIALDTSGSVGSEDLGRYLNVTTSFFKYGIQQIDVLMFDAKVQGKPLALTDAKKNIKELKVCGRGWTDFQAPVDYAVEHPEYDGLIIITDGYAPCPNTEQLRTKLLWVIDNESSYKNIHENLRKTGRVCLLER